MRVILVGPARDRARLRSQLDSTPVEIVGESLTAAEARATGDEIDASIIASGSGGDDRTRRDLASDDEPVEPLTPREIQVLELLAEGLANKAIAQALGISDQTVKFHVSSISGKLGAANRTDAVRRAVRRGLIAL